MIQTKTTEQVEKMAVAGSILTRCLQMLRSSARPSSPSLSASASACGWVRGKPSRMNPSAASPESIRSAITPTITSSGTRSPRSMYPFAVRPSSVSSRTAALRMSPVA